MLANRTSRWSIGAAVLCIAVLVASWFLLVSPRRADAAAVRAETVSAENQAGQLQAQIAELQAEFADLPKRKAELEAIKKKLPPKAEIPAFVRDMQSIAARAGLSLDSIVPGTPVVLASSATPAAPVPGASAVAPIGSVVSVPMTIAITGDYFEATLFVKYLQTRVERSYLISGLAGVAAPEEEPAPTTAPVVPTATGTATPTPVPTVAPTVAAADTETLDRVTLTVTGSVFVLMDGTSTLDQITADAKAAAAAGVAPGATPTTAPTGAPTAATN